METYPPATHFSSSRLAPPQDTGLTPLHDAASKGQAEAARLLLGKGADVHARGNVRARPCRARVVGGAGGGGGGGDARRGDARRRDVTRRKATRAVGGRGLAAGGGRAAADRRRGVRPAGELTRVLVPESRAV